MPRLVRPVLVAALTVLLTVQLGAQTFSGEVVGITDGDTITVMREGEAVRVRLDGIDSPERGQDFSQRAKAFTSALVFRQTVTVDVRDVDRYGRLVGRVFVSAQDLSLALVQAGFAWHYTQYSSDGVLAAAEIQARAARSGLWAVTSPMPPWQFRNGGAPAASATSATTDQSRSRGPYHGNVRSKVFHGPWCQHYACKNCTAEFATREEAIAAGYRPGGNCKP